MAKREERVVDTAGKKPIQDLREWLERVGALGDLLHVKEPVSCDEEMSAISYLVAKQKTFASDPIRQHQRVRDSPFKARSLWNISRTESAAHCRDDGRAARHSDSRIDSPCQRKLNTACHRANCRRSKLISIRTTLTGDRIDFDATADSKAIGLWMAVVMLEPADAVITRDPDTGYLNIGTYRMMLQGKKEAGLYLSPGKDARLHITRSWQMANRLKSPQPGASTRYSGRRVSDIPKNVSEYEFSVASKANPSQWSKEKRLIFSCQRMQSSSSKASFNPTR